MNSFTHCTDAHVSDVDHDADWTLLPPFCGQAVPFRSLEQVFALRGETIGSDALSKVLRVEHRGRRYYVKRYHRAGKYLRRFVGRSRIRAEWENLLQLRRWGIATPPVVGYGERRTAQGFRGALITAELPGTLDLATLAARDDVRLRDGAWLDRVGRQLAAATRTLHRHGFAHNDLKWRNLLVDNNGRLSFIDCPAGRHWRGALLRYRVIKDLACLDKVAKRQLSRSRRLRFYLDYLDEPRLRRQDKTQLRKLLGFFDGRD